MAEAWGMHPEDVYTRPGGLRWAAWWRVYREEAKDAQDNPPPSKRPKG